MIGKIVTLESDIKYLILLSENVDNKEFLVGVKVVDDKYTNEFKLFLEKKKENEMFLEEIQDEAFLKVLVNSYILDNLDL